jgi:hypothetical protein
MLQNNRNKIRSNPALALISRWFRLSQTRDRAEPGIEEDLNLEPFDRRPDCGAYNEAFVIQNWASFGPHF